MQVAEDLLYLPVLELKRLIAGKELSPVELVGSCLERIERLQPKLNAFVWVLAEEAREQAKESEGRVLRGEARPLEGIPIPIKDNVLLAGAPMMMGSRMGLNFSLPMDQELVTRLRHAGAVFPGKTALPEFGSTAVTESLLHGITRNPWNTNHTPGGSSGGSAASVAAGIAPAAHGNDGGGSLRIPASCCGLFSLKVSRGVVSHYPIPDVTGLVSDGFLTRTVADNAFLLDLIYGSMPGDPWPTWPRQRPWQEEVDEPGRLRIAIQEKSPSGAVVDPACLAAVRHAATLFEELGHVVVPYPETVGSEEELTDTFMEMWASVIGYNMEALMALGADPEQAEPHNLELWQRSQKLPSSKYLLAMHRLQEYSRQEQENIAEFDLVLSPTLAQPPVPVGTQFPEGETDPMHPFHRDFDFVSFTPGANLAGLPAAALPLHWHDGLPIGVQVVAKPNQEALLFRFSAQVEQAQPWADQRPPLN